MTGKKTETLKVNFGPQHPSTHGVLYVKVELDGETIVEAKPQLGYLHRAVEKLSENRYYHHAIPALDRCDYLTPIFNEVAYCMAVEKLAGIKVPERAEYLRVILSELNRITSHQLFAGFFLADLGTMFTPLMYSLGDRESLLELWNEVSGSRMFPNFIRIGGVREDTPEGWLAKLIELLDQFEVTTEKLHNLIENEIFKARTSNIVNLTTEQAINTGITGPMLRATGFDWDLRRDEPYSIYDRFDFNVITAQGGDLRAMYDVRMLEIEESIKIIRQAIKQIPEGPVLTKVPSPLKPEKGDAYAKIESPKGELGIYVVSDGTDKPYRMKVRAPSFVNLRSLEDMARGWKIADFIVILGVIDIVLGDVDR
jgi:NADH-quinone oxidoreductase subunit D